MPHQITSSANLVDIECKKDGGGCVLAVPMPSKPKTDVSGTETKASHQTNYLQTLMHLLNGFIGSGILSMPLTFHHGGILLASIVNPLVGVLSCHCIHMLLAINRTAMQRTNSPPLDYHELAEYAFQIGPNRTRKYAKLARYTVLSVLVATQIGGCCVYFIFIATNIRKFLINVLDADRAPSPELCLFLMLPIVILINWIRNIRKLTLLSTVSNVLQVAGMGIIFYNLLSSPLPSVSRFPQVGDRIPQFFVSTLFIFEGISVSMSLFKAIDKPQKFYRPFGVLNVGLFLITAFYFAVGFLGYLRYGSDVQASITVSLPSNPLNDAVQLMYALAVLFTYPIILYVPIQVLWPIIKRKFFTTNDLVPKPKTKILTIVYELLFRTSLVVFTYILASIIPKLELIISLVGSITSSSIMVIIPATLHLVAFWNQTNGLYAKAILLVKNLSILAIGLCGFVFGFYFSLMDIIESYQDNTIETELEIIQPTLNNSSLMY